jgi:hypothetical protein
MKRSEIYEQGLINCLRSELAPEVDITPELAHRVAAQMERLEYDYKLALSCEDRQKKEGGEYVPF